MKFFLVLTLLIAVTIVVFTAQNPTVITLTFINWTVTGHVALILAVPFVVGVIAGLSLLMPVWWKKVKIVKANKKRIHELESELSSTSQRLEDEESKQKTEGTESTETETKQDSEEQ